MFFNNSMDTNVTPSAFTFTFPNGGSVGVSVSTTPPSLLPPSFDFHANLAQTSFASPSDLGKRTYSSDSEDETDATIETEAVGNKRFQPFVTGILPEDRKRTVEADETSGKKRYGKYKSQYHPLSVVPGELHLDGRNSYFYRSHAYDWGVGDNAPCVSIKISNPESLEEGKRNYPAYEEDDRPVMDLRGNVGTWQAEYSRLPDEGHFPVRIPLAIVMAGLNRAGRIQLLFQGTRIDLALGHNQQMDVPSEFRGVNDFASNLAALILLNQQINFITAEDIEIAQQQAQLLPQIIAVVKRTIAPEPALARTSSIEMEV